MAKRSLLRLVLCKILHAVIHGVYSFCRNAAGAWAADIAQMAGIDLPVEPRSRFNNCGGISERWAHRSRSVFSFHCKDETFGSSCPLVVDPSGVYFRPEVTCHTPVWDVAPAHCECLCFE